MAGWQKGGFLITVDEEKLARDLAKNRYLHLVSAERGNNKLTIRVHERTPVAYTICHGIYYTLDNRGMVLEEYATDHLLSGLVLTDKLQINSCIVGKHIVLKNRNTLDVYIQLMLEIKAMSLQGDIASVNMDDLANLSLYTRDGYFVRLGDTTYLHGKLRAMMLVLDQLRSDPEQYKAGGIIDVSNREYPTYSPPETDL